MAEYREGQTATNPSTGERVRYTGGTWVPVTASGSTAPGARLLPSGPRTGDRRSEEAYWGKLRTAGDPALQAAQNGVGSARRAEGLIARQEAQGQGTGGIYAVPVVGQIAGLLDPEVRELNAISSAAARQNRQPGEGAISDFDAAQFVAMTYGADKPTETNRALIQAQRAADDSTLQKREFQEWYVNRYNTVNGSNEAWRSYAQENPIFDPSAQQDGAAPVLNRGRQNWREYFTGEKGLDTQAEIDARRSQGENVGPIDEATGLPTYPGLTALSANIRDDGFPSGGQGGGGPGSSPENAIDVAALSDEQKLALPPGAYLRVGDTPLGRLSAPAMRSAPQEGDVAVGGINTRPTAEDRGWTPESAVAQRDNLNPILRGVDAFGRGFADMGSLEFADEIAAGGDALFGQGVGDSFGQRFRNNVAVQRAVDEDDGRDAGFARGLGEVAGGVAGAFIGGPAALRSVANIRSPLLRGALTFGRNAATGAALGGTAAAGNARGDALNRAQAFLKAAPVAGAFGAVIPAGLSGGGAIDRLLGAPVARASGAISRGVSRVAGDIGSALGVPGASALTERATISPLQSAIDQFGPRMGSRRISALGETAQGQRDLGFDPTFADLLDDGGQGSLRALATMDTPARPLAVDFGRDRRVDAQTDVSNIARNFISDDPRTAARVAADLDVDQRLASGAAYSEARASAPITVSPDVGEALFSGDGPRQIRSAAQAYKSSVKPEERALALELESMAQAAEGGVPAGPVEMSVGAADLLSQYLNKAGGADANLSRIYQGLGREIRTQARNQSPEYEAALSGYAERAQLQDASNVGGRFLGRRGTQDFVNEAEAMLPAQKEVARVAARDAVEDAGNTTSGAATLLDDLSVGRGRGQRTDAFVEDAEGLRATAEAARNRLNTGRNVDPRNGSPTFLNSKDGENVEGAVQFMSDTAQILRNPISGIPTVTARRLQNRGFNKDEAEAIVTAALDPAQTDTLVRMLSQRMSRREARSLARAVHRSLTSATGSASVQ